MRERKETWKRHGWDRHRQIDRHRQKDRKILLVFPYFNLKMLLTPIIMRFSQILNIGASLLRSKKRQHLWRRNFFVRNIQSCYFTPILMSCRKFLHALGIFCPEWNMQIMWYHGYSTKRLRNNVHAPFFYAKTELNKCAQMPWRDQNGKKVEKIKAH